MSGSVAAEERRTRSAAAGLVRAVPVWVWLGGLVALSTVVRYGLGRRMVAPWIMVDELIYSELAKSLAATGHFLVRDQASNAYGFVYPALISPAYRVFGSVPDAYAAAKAINALVMSLAAVPAYFLARRVLAPPLSLLAAALTVAVPSMIYTGTLMTENAFYPIFLAAALALVLYLERPTLLRALVLLAVCGLAFVTRAQALALGPAILTAPALVVWAGRRGWRGLAAYRALYALAGAGALLLLGFQLARGRSLDDVLGAYKVAGQQSYAVGTVARWFLYHAAELDLYLGVAPFAALILVAGLARRLPGAVQIFVAASLALSFWLLLEVAAFASLPSVNRVEERNTFYLAPLFLIALLLWIELGLPRPPPAAALAALLAAALPGVLPYHTLINVTAVSDTLALLPWWSLQNSVITLSEVPAVVVLCSIAVAALFFLVPPRFGLLVPALVLVYFAAAQKPIEGRVRTTSVGSLFAGITNPQRDWVDRAVGREAKVAVVWSGNTAAYAIWENEFFSRSAGRVYYLSDPLPGGLPETPVTVDRRSGLLRGPDGRPVESRYVLTDGSVTLAGRPIARDARKGILLYRVDGPLRSTTRVTGLYPSDTWSGPEVSYTRLSCRGGSVTVLLDGDPGLFTRPQTVTARVGGVVVARARVTPGVPRRLRVPLQPRGGRCEARFTVRPTAIPAVVTKGENPDPRVLGIHFTRFAYSPPAPLAGPGSRRAQPGLAGA